MPVTNSGGLVPLRANPLIRGLTVIALVVALALGLVLVRSTMRMVGAFGNSAPRMSQEMIVERLRDVAKLVATEMTLRDVVIYEQTRFHSTKRVLLVVTTAQQSGILEHADQAASRALQDFLARDGYTVRVTRPLALDQPGG